MSLRDFHADRIEQHEDGSMTLTLRKPLAAKDGAIGYLTLRRPDLDDLLGQERQPGDDMDKAGWLISRTTLVPVEAFEEIDAEDGMVLSELLGDFLGQLPEDGAAMRVKLTERHADRITKTADGASLRLLKALATKDGTIAEIEVRRPSWKEMKAQKARTLAASAKLIATLSGIGPLSLGKIDGLDALILGEIISDFLGSSRRIGGA